MKDICVCGHVRTQHRDRGKHSCRKCTCKSYEPKTEEEKPTHPTDCNCLSCHLNRMFKDVEQLKRDMMGIKQVTMAMLEAIDTLNKTVHKGEETQTEAKQDGEEDGKKC